MSDDNLFSKRIRKDCFSKDRLIYEFSNEKKINDDFVAFLLGFGQVKVFKDFPIPLINMDVPDKMRLSALFNSSKVDIFFKEKRPEGFVEDFEKKLNEFLTKKN